jgi:tRNA threonylcarbamoyladenosine biosynthesis protein TsaB
MRLLCLDGSLARSSAALLADGEVLARGQEDGARGHPSALPVLAERVLAEAGLSATGLDAVAVVVGPGGFTGLRAAIALAEGIALGAGLPLVGVTTGEALAAALPEPLRAARAVWTAVDNRRGRVVLECFAPGAAVPEAPPRAVAERDLPPPGGPVALAGDGAALVAARLLAPLRRAAGGPRGMTPAAAADAPALAALHAAAFPPAEAWGPDAIRLMLEMPGAFGLMAPGRGFVLARVAADEAEVLTLAVVAACRRQGVGAALLAGAMAGAVLRGARTMFLEVSEANGAARAIYAAAGFEEAGRRRRYYADGSDALVLRRALLSPLVTPPS